MNYKYSRLLRVDSTETCSKCDNRAEWLHEWATRAMRCTAFYYYCDTHNPAATTPLKKLREVTAANVAKYGAIVEVPAPHVVKMTRTSNAAKCRAERAAVIRELNRRVRAFDDALDFVLQEVGLAKDAAR